ncbi:MAG: phosphate ABC transporter permease PstA [Halieaceae bacterium]|jgi:phosphate transport system permease protein|nr:phosphate ABC transporter permease PstA [Halieaceae bacterium]
MRHSLTAFLSRRGNRLLRLGEPMVWLNAGAVSLSMIAVLGLLGLLAFHGLGYFWPRPVALYEMGPNSRVLAERVSVEQVDRAQLQAAGYPLPAGAGDIARLLLKRGNRDVYGTDFVWLLQHEIVRQSFPPDALRVEREEWGNLYGFLEAVLRDGEVVADTASTPEATWQRFNLELERSRRIHAQIRKLEQEQIAGISRRLERLQDKRDSPQFRAEYAALESDYQRALRKLETLYAEDARHAYRVRLADRQLLTLPLGQVVRAVRPNRMSLLEKLDYYRERVWEFLSAAPREANTEGGVYPAIFGTVLMVLLMSIVVTPFGVLAAVFLNEVAGQGRITRVFRAAVNNLAGVPSIVYGIFGLGFFVYGIGGEVDSLFFADSLPSPTYGTPGIMWASLTLALLTLPVVIVATEEGLARIPRSVREGSLALGATRAETLWRVVLPMASPAMMTGVILAVARAAGEVAPLMLVGVVKLAPSLPVDGIYPYLHLEQKFMHLGFHIYDLGFQSPNIEAARPLVYATALLLVIIIALLNFAAVTLRNRLRERYSALDAG